MQTLNQIRLNDSAVILFDPYTDATGKAYQSGTYGLTWGVTGNGLATPVTVAGVANGAGWKVTVGPTVLSAAGVKASPSNQPYLWFANLAATGERVSAWTGDLVVLPDLAANDAGVDPRSQEEKDLAAIRATISARIGNGTPLKYTIGNRSLENEPMKSLLELESRYKLLVTKQKAAQSVANGLGNPGRVMARFGEVH